MIFAYGKEGKCGYSGSLSEILAEIGILVNQLHFREGIPADVLKDALNNVLLNTSELEFLANVTNMVKDADKSDKEDETPMDKLSKKYGKDAAEKLMEAIFKENHRE